MNVAQAHFTLKDCSAAFSRVMAEAMQNFLEILKTAKA